VLQVFAAKWFILHRKHDLTQANLEENAIRITFILLLPTIFQLERFNAYMG